MWSRGNSFFSYLKLILGKTFLFKYSSIRSTLGEKRAGYQVKDLLNLFAQARTDGEELDDDKLLLGA